MDSDINLEHAQQTASILCENCQKSIARASFILHEVHCVRNTVLCPQCMQSVLKSEIEEHVADEHTSVTCPFCKTSTTRKDIRQSHGQSPCVKCGQQVAACELNEHMLEKHSHVTCPGCLKNVKQADLEQHQSVLCEKRQIACKFCELPCSAVDNDEHENMCGSRTEFCTICKRNILVRDMKGHINTNCRWPSIVDSHLPGGERRMQNVYNRIVPLNDGFSNWHVSDDFDLRTTDSISAERLFDERVQRYSNCSYSSSDDEQPANEGDKLPCEFCEQLFDVEELMIHQVNLCYNARRQLETYMPEALKRGTLHKVINEVSNEVDDAVRVKPKTPINVTMDAELDYPVTFNVDEDRRSDRRQLSEVRPEHVEIPCQFCFEKFDSSVIGEHEHFCYSQQLRELEMISSTNKPSEIGDADIYRYPYALMDLEDMEKLSRNSSN